MNELHSCLDKVTQIFSSPLTDNNKRRREGEKKSIKYVGLLRGCIRQIEDNNSVIRLSLPERQVFIETYINQFEALLVLHHVEFYFQHLINHEDYKAVVAFRFEYSSEVSDLKETLCLLNKNLEHFSHEKYSDLREKIRKEISQCAEKLFKLKPKSILSEHEAEIAELTETARLLRRNILPCLASNKLMLFHQVHQELVKCDKTLKTFQKPSPKINSPFI